VFSGFPAGKVAQVYLPEPFFAEILPIIDDLAELKVTLHVFWQLGKHPGRVQYVRYLDLATDALLLEGLGPSPTAALDAALERAVQRRTLLQAEDSAGETADRVYFANTPKGRAAVEALANGRWPDELELAERPNIFNLYEQNVGTLAPLMADELREAEQTYPHPWIEEAFRIAVTRNKRNWRYIRAILERWHTEGKDDETSRRPAEQDGRQYLEGEYGEFIQH
jgi:DnaD/phage-associated family protein